MGDVMEAPTTNPLGLSLHGGMNQDFFFSFKKKKTWENQQEPTDWLLLGHLSPLRLQY